MKQERIERKAALVEAEKGIATLDELRAEGMRWWPRHEQAYERLQTGRTALMERLDDLNRGDSRPRAGLRQLRGSSDKGRQDHLSEREDPHTRDGLPQSGRGTEHALLRERQSDRSHALRRVRARRSVILKKGSPTSRRPTPICSSFFPVSPVLDVLDGPLHGLGRRQPGLTLRVPHGLGKCAHHEHIERHA